MEDGKRKKKNKKSKGKSAKTVDNAAAGSGETMKSEPEMNQESASQQNHQEIDTGTADDAHDRGEPTKAVDNVTLSSEEPMQAGSEVNHKPAPEQNHQEPDTGIVGAQNASVMDSEVELERHMVKEPDFAAFQETIKDLQNNIISCIEKEARLEKKIEVLQNENEFFVKKEINWNLKFEQLQSEMHSCSIREVSLENKINNMEAENDSRTSKENLISEMVARLEEANTGLQMQVKELERSRDNLVHDNQQLTSSISLLESRVQLLESEAASFRSSTRMMTKHIFEYSDSEKQVEPLSEPSEKLVTVEPELVGEVKEQNGIAEHSATLSVPSTEADSNALPVTYLLPHEEIISESTDKFASPGTFFETISITDASVNGIADAGVHPKELPLLDELNGSAEIVQIPLDDNHVQQIDTQDINNDEKKAVPFSDAPLIGAPFRFVSFVAKFVSGADLVKENGRNSGR